MKILAVGDLHFRNELGYADYIPDHREAEKKGVLDFIVKQAKNHEAVVLLGDIFNARNNSSKVIREVVEFIERFEDKEVYMIAGN